MISEFLVVVIFNRNFRQAKCDSHFDLKCSYLNQSCFHRTVQKSRSY